MTLVDFIKENSLDQKYQEIVLFGGSFNPWHSGHGSCLKLMDPQKMILVMPDHNPFKDVTAKEDRFSSIEDIEKELKIRPNNTYLFTGFLEQDFHNPTHNWLRELKKEFPQHKLSLLMGFDSYMSLDKWIEAKEILNTLDTIYVASRLDNSEAKQSQFHLLKSVSPKIKIDFIGRHQFEHLSSTQLREE